MAIPHAQPGEVISVAPLGAALADARTKTLFKTAQVEVIRIVMQTGKVIPQHTAPGEIIVQCLEGRLEWTSSGKSCELESGQMLYLEAGEPHTVRCIEDASFLLTILPARSSADE